MRNKLHSYLTCIVFCAALGTTGSSFGATISSIMDWGGMSDGFQAENSRLEGTWHDAKQWKGSLCNGYYEYQYTFKGDVGKVDFVLNEQGTVDVIADLSNIYVGGNGVYRSESTLCVPLKGWTGVRVDTASLHSVVSFTGTGQSLKDMKLKIVETKLGTIHVGSAVPGWMEKFLTKQVNKTLQKVWASRLGDWLADKIAEAIKKQLPEGGQRPLTLN